ncbi:RNA-guided endonuclease InsQ/TnpB family protein [Halococcus sediminicola]|uniref:RNA-guided endonuclease InsQ/TnpB family protein n=1 Tax=Halococcus sediminicola TaxID=1264579 RepID=UPI00137720A0|nr:RNA-guided endonuclease TnpB family protein [Halococcus sediminicola]
MKEEFPDHSLKAHTAYEAAFKVAEAFGSWDSNGRPSDNHPGRPFGRGSYIRFDHSSVELVENDRGYGVKLGLEPRKPEWFHLPTGDYQREYFDRVTDGDAETASAEVHLSSDGATLHLVVKEDVEVYDATDVPRFVGVDIGETVLYAAAVTEVLNSPSVEAVEMQPGREFRHYRDRLNEKRKRLGEKGDLRGVRECRGDRERYTEQVTDEASRAIVDLAQSYAPCGIALENLTGYRQTAEDAIHDWPFALMQKKIAYKATGAGIPVESINAAGTSTTCRKCGQTDAAARDGSDFACHRCGYEIHADVNAAINIAQRAAE